MDTLCREAEKIVVNLKKRVERVGNQIRVEPARRVRISKRGLKVVERNPVNEISYLMNLKKRVERCIR